MDNPLTDDEIRRLLDIAKIELDLFNRCGNRFEKYGPALLVELEKELQLQYNANGSLQNVLASENVENIRDILLRRRFKDQFETAIAAEKRRVTEMERPQRRPVPIVPKAGAAARNVAETNIPLVFAPGDTVHAAAPL